MKLSIRTKFALGMIFIFLIILVLMGFSAFYLNKLSNKTSAILKENYLSVVYAREMSEGLMNVNQEIAASFLENKHLDSQVIQMELDAVGKSLQLEKGNITEPGEDKLVAGIETGFVEYRDSIRKFMGSVPSADRMLYFQKKLKFLSRQIVLLSQMNGKAIEAKTDDAKVSSKNAVTGMTILGSFCFLIALSFIYSFASYFNERFFQLYNGIKEIASSNYGQRLYFDGADEFNEISVVFNQMAEKLSASHPEKFATFLDNPEMEDDTSDFDELKDVLSRIKSI
jgi:methyl-accepting chemotaxis protein